MYQPYQSTWNNPYLSQNPYQPVIPSQTIPPQTAQQVYGQPYNGITKVNGPQSAMQINLPPNSISNPMIDSNFDGKNGTFYIVSTDGTGSKSLEAFDFAPHVEQSISVDGAQFVSRQEFDEFAAKVNAVLGAQSGIDGPVQPAAGTQGADGATQANDAGGHLGGGVGAGAK